MHACMARITDQWFPKNIGDAYTHNINICFVGIIGIGATEIGGKNKEAFSVSKLMVYQTIV